VLKQVFFRHQMRHPLVKLFQVRTEVCEWQGALAVLRPRRGRALVNLLKGFGVLAAHELFLALSVILNQFAQLLSNVYLQLLHVLCDNLVFLLRLCHHEHRLEQVYRILTEETKLNQKNCAVLII
jgi:hypothetical protein